jgi:cardiolipin synthase A/B
MNAVRPIGSAAIRSAGLPPGGAISPSAGSPDRYEASTRVAPVRSGIGSRLLQLVFGPKDPPSVLAVKLGASAVVSEIDAARTGLIADGDAILRAIEGQPAAKIVQVARRFEAVHGVSLRQVIHERLFEDWARRATRALDDARVKVFGSDRSAIETVLELRRIGGVSTFDLVSPHELTSDNSLELFVGGKQAFAEIFSAIDAAEDHIHVSYYIFRDDEIGNTFADKLIAKAKQGIPVRVMVDSIGSAKSVLDPAGILSRMEEAGVEVIRNHPVSLGEDGVSVNRADHRKIVVVDGQIAFTGGMNVGDEYVDRVHDLVVKLRGPAVRQMQVEYLKSWLRLGGTIDPDAAEEDVKARYFPKPERFAGGPKVRVAQAIPGENAAIFEAYTKLIREAKESIYIETPYLTSPIIEEELMAAAKRGVEVHLVLPAESDHGFTQLAARAAFPAMIGAGVHIHEYPGFCHGKLMIVDGEKITFGSSNLDDVALFHIFELDLNITDRRFAETLRRRVFEVDIARSKTARIEDVGMFERAAGGVVNQFSHWI